MQNLDILTKTGIKFINLLNLLELYLLRLLFYWSINITGQVQFPQGLATHNDIHIDRIFKISFWFLGTSNVNTHWKLNIDLLPSQHFLYT